MFPITNIMIGIDLKSASDDDASGVLWKLVNFEQVVFA